MIGGTIPGGLRSRKGFGAETMPSRDRFHTAMAAALEAIDEDDGGERIAIRNPALLVARARAERAGYTCGGPGIADG